MTNFSDETLMAFADGELDPATRAAVDAAVRADPDIERRVAQHRAMRARVQMAYAAELDETPPARLLAAARGTGTKPMAVVSNLADARAANAARKAAAQPRWRPLVSAAASLLIGVGIGYFALHRSDLIVADNDGGLVARGALAKALSNQLGSERPPSAAVQVGLSFLSKSGAYCRVFTMTGAAPSGVACRGRDDWQIQVLAQSSRDAAGAEAHGNYRTAGSALSPVILNAVQQQIAGEPLDQDGEITARRRNWRSVAH